MWEFLFFVRLCFLPFAFLKSYPKSGWWGDKLVSTVLPCKDEAVSLGPSSGIKTLTLGWWGTGTPRVCKPCNLAELVSSNWDILLRREEGEYNKPYPSLWLLHTLVHLQIHAHVYVPITHTYAHASTCLPHMHMYSCIYIHSTFRYYSSNYLMSSDICTYVSQLDKQQI